MDVLPIKRSAPKKSFRYDATSMIAGYTPGKTATISTTVYQLWLTDQDAEAFKWVLINIAISAIVLLAVNMLERWNTCASFPTPVTRSCSCGRKTQTRMHRPFAPNAPRPWRPQPGRPSPSPFAGKSCCSSEKLDRFSGFCYNCVIQ